MPPQTGPSLLNYVVSDGETVVATRWVQNLVFGS